MGRDASEAAAAYRAELDRISSSAERVTDKNPFNFAWLGAIRLALPDAFIIHCRRTPVDTCLSAYMTVSSGSATFPTSRARLVFYYRQYQRIVAHWASVLPKRRTLDIDYDTLVAHPARETRRVIAFCELPWHDACLCPELNRRPIHTASLLQAREPIYATSSGRWQCYAPYLGELATLQDTDCPTLHA